MEESQQKDAASLTIVGELDVSVSSGYEGYLAYGFMEPDELSPDSEVVVYLQMERRGKVYTAVPQIAQAIGLPKDEYGNYPCRYHAALLAWHGVYQWLAVCRDGSVQTDLYVQGVLSGDHQYVGHRGGKDHIRSDRADRDGAFIKRGAQRRAEKGDPDAGISAALPLVDHSCRHAARYPRSGWYRERLSAEAGCGTDLLHGGGRYVPADRRTVGSVEGIWLRNDRVSGCDIEHRPESVRGGGDGWRQPLAADDAHHDPGHHADDHRHGDTQSRKCAERRVRPDL